MIRKRRVFVIVLFVLLLMPLMRSEAAPEKSFTLGVLAPYTGASAMTGIIMKNAAVMAFEKIGYKINDYKIQLVYIDTQSDPAKSASAYAEALEKKGVQASILSWSTAEVVSCMRIMTQRKVPHFFGMSAGKTINEVFHSLPENERYYMMKGWGPSEKVILVYAECLDNAISKGIWKPEKKLMALWGEDSDWQRGNMAALKAYLHSKGWEIFTEEFFPLTQTEFYPFVNKCKQAGVTALAGGSSAANCVSALVKQAREVGFKGLILADGMGYIGDWYKLTGPASDGVLDMQPQISTKKQQEWAKEYETKYGSKPSPSGGGLAYDYANFFIKIAKRAIEKYGSLDSETLTKVGREELLTGKLTYSLEDGALMMRRYGTNAEVRPDPIVGTDWWFLPIIQYNKGKGYIVYPEVFKEAELVVK